MYTVIKTDDFSAVQGIILKHIDAGGRLSMVASKDGDLYRFQINTMGIDDEPSD